MTNSDEREQGAAEVEATEAVGVEAAAVELALAAAESAGAQAEEVATVEIMELLHEHVPLTLLADLADPAGPASPEILEEEGLPDVAWWEAGEGPGAAGEGE